MIKDQSFTVPKEDRLNREACVIQMDYFEFEEIRILMMVEKTSCFMAARVVDDKSFKGHMDQKVAMVADFIIFTGRKDITLQCDSEASIWLLAQGVAERFQNKVGDTPYAITTRHIAPGASNSNGSVERAVRIVRDQIRVLAGHFRHKFEFNLEHSSKPVPWLVRHSAY